MGVCPQVDTVKLVGNKASQTLNFNMSQLEDLYRGAHGAILTISIT